MIIAIIQARMGSSRLPGKVMLDICEKPVLWHVVKRVKHSKYIDEVVVATSIEEDNNKIREFCSKNNILNYSGSENDVLDRFYQAAKYMDIKENDIIIRITADCPLIDPNIIDTVIEAHKNENADYTSNVIKPTFPDGLDCEVVKFSTLAKAWKNAKLKSEREHVTSYIRNNPELFKISSVENNIDLSPLRWTLDEKEDFELISQIYELLYREDSLFFTSEILEVIRENPRLSLINDIYIRNEGLLKSLLEDKKE